MAAFDPVRELAGAARRTVAASRKTKWSFRMDGNPNRIRIHGLVRSRRSFLRLAAAAAGSLLAASAASAKKKPKKAAATIPAAPPIKPRVLKAGDTVGLIAPASYTFDLWRLDDAAARVEALGLKPKFGKYV